MLLQGVSAFMTRSIRDTRSASVSSSDYCNTNHRCKSSKHQQYDNIFRDCNTQLYAETDNGDNLEDVLKATSKGTKKSKSKGTSSQKKTTNNQPIEISKKSLSKSQSIVHGNEEENDDYKEYNIPKTGISLSDQLETKSPENKERFETTLTPIVTGISTNSDDNEKKIEFNYDDDGFPIGYKEIKENSDDTDDKDEKDSARHQGVARIDTISTLGNAGEEPVRWLVSLDDTTKDSDDKQESFALIDLPPYSDRLVDDIRTFMDPEYNNNTTVATSSSSEDTISSSKANLDIILLTNQQCIHYNTSPGVYVKRKSELTKWKQAFPNAQVVMYRLDIPRECREEVTQVLDGYGPWGWEEVGEEGGSGVGVKNKFVETGRPLTIEEWDDDTKAKVLTQGELPPDDQFDNQVNSSDDDTNSAEEDELYSSEAIRKREENYRLLAVYTPGSTFGSVTYILPQRGICCSGHALPIESSGNTAIEDNYDEDDDYSVSSSSPVPPQGPRLDYQGYLASSASRPRQMSSASALISSYIDRFRVVLPARGDIVFLDSDENTRKRELMESVGLYQKVSDIYNRLGIVE